MSSPIIEWLVLRKVTKLQNLCSPQELELMKVLRGCISVLAIASQSWNGF